MTAAGATPIFTDIFAEQWESLPLALKAHYANRPFSNDRVTVSGHLTIRMGPLLQLAAPMLKALNMLTPWTGDDVPCKVTFRSKPDSRAFIFERHFDFPGRKPYLFRSKMIPQGPHEVIEYMAGGIGWRCGYVYESGQVLLQHRGYVWRIFGMDIPLSWIGECLLGRGDAFEESTGDDRFRMRMTLSGGLFGRLTAYSYEGAFIVTDIQYAE
ncbi:DUF4166 domain-containing protein [Asticcacaulis taihuensis]|uniref:DUF4166 domain-containing protein n=1 Tax=Asticcacaulis taihuensis TaxID=260084 RepID=UPI0026ED6CFD|nr:DUF4166 domain-containing protein [Asticcacaulis taihuensis]